jgi:hypothetical protein
VAFLAPQSHHSPGIRGRLPAMLPELVQKGGISHMNTAVVIFYHIAFIWAFIYCIREIILYFREVY